MHWNTVSTANRMLSKFVMPKFGPVQYSLHSVSFGQILAGSSRPHGQSVTLSPGNTQKKGSVYTCFYFFKLNCCVNVVTVQMNGGPQSGCVHMALGVLVMNLILVWITCSQRSLEINIPNFPVMINASVPMFDCCILFCSGACDFYVFWVFFFTAQTVAASNSEKSETTIIHCNFSIIKCQHHIADILYPPNSEQWEKRTYNHFAADLERPELWLILSELAIRFNSFITEIQFLHHSRRRMFLLPPSYLFCWAGVCTGSQQLSISGVKQTNAYMLEHPVFFWRSPGSKSRFLKTWIRPECNLWNRNKILTCTKSNKQSNWDT